MALSFLKCSPTFFQKNLQKTAIPLLKSRSPPGTLNSVPQMGQKPPSNFSRIEAIPNVV